MCNAEWICRREINSEWNVHGNKCKMSIVGGFFFSVATFRFSLVDWIIKLHQEFVFFGRVANKKLLFSNYFVSTTLYVADVSAAYIKQHIVDCWNCPLPWEAVISNSVSDCHPVKRQPYHLYRRLCSSTRHTI